MLLALHHYVKGDAAEFYQNNHPCAGKHLRIFRDYLFRHYWVILLTQSRLRSDNKYASDDKTVELNFI